MQLVWCKSSSSTNVSLFSKHKRLNYKYSNKNNECITFHLYRLRIEAQLTDITGSITATVFGKEAEQIFDINAAEIKEYSIIVSYYAKYDICISY